MSVKFEKCEQFQTDIKSEGEQEAKNNFCLSLSQKKFLFDYPSQTKRARMTTVKGCKVFNVRQVVTITSICSSEFNFIRG